MLHGSFSSLRRATVSYQFLPELGQGIAHRQGQTATEGAEGTRFQGVEGVSVLAAIL